MDIFDAAVTSSASVPDAYLLTTGHATASLSLTTAFVLESSVTLRDPDGFIGTAPSAFITANSGGYVSAKLPACELVASGTVLAVGRVDAKLPACQLISSGHLGSVGRASLVAPSVGVLSLGGATSNLATTGRYTVIAGAVTGGVATVTLILTGAYGVSAAVSLENYGSALLTSPSLVAAPSGQAWLVAPRFTLSASGGEVIVLAYEAYAINLTTGAVSHYTNYPFDNILRFGNKYYGVKSDGLFEIGGAVDLTLPIEAHVKTFMTDFGSKNQKRLPYVYVSGRSDGGVIIGVTADEGDTYEYESDWGEVAGSANHRTTVGKGIRGVHYSLDVKNVNGGSLELDEITAHVAPTQRGV